MRLLVRGNLCFFLVAVGLSACASLRPQPAKEALLDVTVKSNWTASRVAPLRNGEYREPAAPGSASSIIVKLSPFVSQGRVDNRDVAAAVIITDPGGSGTFYDLGLFVLNGTEWQNTDVIALGDRVKVEAIRISGENVVVGVIVHGPEDPVCCPTLRVTRRFAFTKNW